MEDLFDIITEESQKAEQSVNVVSNNLDDLDLIPVAYQICKLVKGKIENGKVVEGQKEILDTKYCDRAKGIVPNQIAIKKADNLKKMDKANTYYVVGMYQELKKRPRKKTYVIVNNLLCEIIHEAKA